MSKYFAQVKSLDVMQLLGTSKSLKDVSSWNAEICAPKLAVWKLMDLLTQVDVWVVFLEQLFPDIMTLLSHLTTHQYPA